jgi:hypothetical protein
MRRSLENISSILLKTIPFWIVFLFILAALPAGLFTQSLKDTADYEFPKRQRTVMEILFGITYFDSGTIIATPKEKGAESRQNAETVKQDTVETGNKLEIRQNESGEILYVYLTLKNPDQKIQVGIFNMLGKQVMEIYEGDYKNFRNPYVLDSTYLPNGLFLCVAQGKSFRLAEKFIVSR